MTGLALALYDKLWPWRYARSKGKYADAGKKSLFLCGQDVSWCRERFNVRRWE